jgi:hypothetical protein
MRLTPESALAARGGTITVWLATFVLAGVLALTWLGYRATNEWQSNAAQLIKRRQQQIAASLTINLARDMRGVQATVIDRREWRSDELGVNVKEVVHLRQPLGNASRASVGRGSHGDGGGCRTADTV